MNYTLILKGGKGSGRYHDGVSHGSWEKTYRHYSIYDQKTRAYLPEKFESSMDAVAHRDSQYKDHPNRAFMSIGHHDMIKPQPDIILQKG